MHAHAEALARVEKVDVDNLHNEYFNKKRLMPYSYVTFCLLNIHHPGFAELNLPYEYEVIEKYISASSHD